MTDIGHILVTGELWCYLINIAHRAAEPKRYYPTKSLWVVWNKDD